MRKLFIFLSIFFFLSMLAFLNPKETKAVCALTSPDSNNNLLFDTITPITIMGPSSNTYNLTLPQCSVQPSQITLSHWNPQAHLYHEVFDIACSVRQLTTNVLSAYNPSDPTDACSIVLYFSEPSPTGTQLDLPSLYRAIQTIPYSPFTFYNSATNRRATVGDIITALLIYIFPIVGLILLIYLIIGGFKYMTSFGNPKSIQSAKETITTALVGFIIIFLAYWITYIMAIILDLPDIRGIF